MYSRIGDARGLVRQIVPSPVSGSYRITYHASQMEHGACSGYVSLRKWKNNGCAIWKARYIVKMKAQSSLLNIINDPRELAKARAELTRMLEVVDFALSKHNGKSNGEQRGGAGIGASAETPSAAQEADAEVLEVVNRFEKKRFSTTDVVLAYGNDGKEKRSRIKLALKRAVKNGKLRLLKPGRGRRPLNSRKPS